jgi:hypothetical protein
MFLVAALAVILAGDQPAGQPVSQAGTPVPAPDTPLELSIGWAATRQQDPFSRHGQGSFTASAPQIGARLRGKAWYLQFAGEFLYANFRNRNFYASVGRDIMSAGPMRFGLSTEFTDIEFRREDPRIQGPVPVTSRNSTAGLLGLNFGFGPYHRVSLRVSAYTGWYRNRYGTVLESQELSVEKSLTDDDCALIGAGIAFEGLTFAERVWMSGSARYLRLSGDHSASLPHDELSATASVNVRLFNVRHRKQLYVGAFVRFGPSGASLLSDRAIGLRGTWRVR